MDPIQEAGTLLSIHPTSDVGPLKSFFDLRPRRPGRGPGWPAANTACLGLGPKRQALGLTTHYSAPELSRL